MLSRSQLNQIADYRYHYFATLASTNQKAFELISQSAATPLIVDTEQQTAGKGQHDRRWCSDQGSLTFSIAVKLNRSQPGLTLLPVLAGVAVCDAINEVLNDLTPDAKRDETIVAEVKWPNDVLIANEKVCGILVQTKPDAAGSGEDLNCVIGIGINVDDPGGALRRDVETDGDWTRFPVGNLQAYCDRNISKSGLLVSVSQRIEQTIANLRLLTRLETETVEKIVATQIWRNGKRIRVQRADGEIISGVHNGIAADGSLIINCDGRIERICSGSILK